MNFYLINKWDPPDQSGHESNDNEDVLHILQTRGLEPHHHMYFDVIPRTQKSFKYFYQILIVIVNTIHSFAHRYMVLSIATTNNSIWYFTQSSGAVEYTNFISAWG